MEACNIVTVVYIQNLRKLQLGQAPYMVCRSTLVRTKTRYCNWVIGGQRLFGKFDSLQKGIYAVMIACVYACVCVCV